jgi:hypothetical protein
MLGPDDPCRIDRQNLPFLWRTKWPSTLSENAEITFVVFERGTVIMQYCNTTFRQCIISQLSYNTKNNTTLHLHSSCSDVHIHYTVRAPSMSSPPPWTNQTKDYDARGRRHFTLAPPAGQRENYEAERVKDFPRLGSAVEHRKIAGRTTGPTSCYSMWLPSWYHATRIMGLYSMFIERWDASRLWNVKWQLE